jgi:hypothetical protein
MNSCLWVNWVLVSDVSFLWKVKSAPSAAARARRAPCLDVCERGVRVCLQLWVCASALRFIFLLVVGVVMPSLGSTRRQHAGRRVAPFPSGAFRLSAAGSNTLNPPLIRPYPPRQKNISQVHAPSPQIERHMRDI